MYNVQNFTKVSLVSFMQAQSDSHCPDEESDPNFKLINSSDMTLGCTLLFVHFSSSISKQIWKSLFDSIWCEDFPMHCPQY